MPSGISVIICTFNGAKRIADPLKSLVTQEGISFSFEVIVVDNGSVDGTQSVVNDFLHLNSSIDIRQIFEGKPGLNRARLAGIYAAKYSYILFCDDDNELSSEYLKIGFEIFESNSAVGAIGGQGIPVLLGKKPDWFDRFSHSYAVGPQDFQSGLINALAAEIYGAGAFFRRELLVRFFDFGYELITSDRTKCNLSSGGDVELCYIIQLSGYRIWYDERLLFKHLIPGFRLEWEYYLQLKKGISSSAGLLLPYTAILKNANGSIANFKFSYVRSLLFASCRLFCSYFKLILLFQKNTSGNILGLTIQRARMISLLFNYKLAIHRFRQLKRWLEFQGQCSSG